MKLFGNRKSNQGSDDRKLLTPDELHRRAEELWAALRANYYRASHEGQIPIPDAELLFRLMNLVEIILDNNKRGRKGFDCGDPAWSRESEIEVFASVSMALQRYLGWEITMPLTAEEQEAKEYRKMIGEELVDFSRRLYGRRIDDEDIDPLAMTDDDLKWLRKLRLLP
jgi:hypothetical protein